MRLRQAITKLSLEESHHLINGLLAILCRPRNWQLQMEETLIQAAKSPAKEDIENAVDWIDKYTGLL